MNTETTKNTPRDAFLYILSIIMLVASAISFGTLVFGLIDIAFPDKLQPYAFINYGAIRVALSTIIIVFPVYFWASRFLHKDVVAHPEKRESKIRRWLMYLTVFVAGLVVIGDLVTLVYNFLQGDIPTSFLLKVLTVFFIAGSSLFYYLSEVKNRVYPRKVFQILVVGVVSLMVVLGFYKAGSPQNQRLIRFDQQKEGHLSMIQDYIVHSYWQSKGALPVKLSDLNDPISSFSVPTDPQTDEQYGYRVLGVRSFQLCASFNLPSSEESTRSISPYYGINNWQHGTGTVCFDRTIDQTLYPVKPL